MAIVIGCILILSIIAINPRAKANIKNSNSNITQDPTLESYSEFAPVPGVNIQISYKLDAKISVDQTSPGGTGLWNLKLNNGRVSVSVTVDRRQKSGSWSKTADLPLGTETEIPINSWLRMPIEVQASAQNINVTGGPAELAGSSLNFSSEGQKGIEIGILDSANPGDEVRINGDVHPQIEAGLKIDLIIHQQTIGKRSVTMPAMEHP